MMQPNGHNDLLSAALDEAGLDDFMVSNCNIISPDLM
jgi:hypothetical protein